MFIMIFFLCFFLSITSPMGQKFHGDHHSHHSHHFPHLHAPKCEHNSSFKTRGYLVFKISLKGCGNFTTIQEAIDAIPTNQIKKLILVDLGIYWERVIVPKNKINIVMQGMGYLNTSTEWNNTAASSNGTFSSFSVGIFGDNFKAFNISFKNTAPSPNLGAIDEQALDLRVDGDKVAFYGCGFYGYQDTLLDQQDISTKSVSYKDQSTLSLVTQGPFIRTVYYGEHRCYGPGANPSERVPYAKQLTDVEAAPFTNISFILNNGDQ